MAPPSAGSVTFVKVCEVAEPKLLTATLAVPSPVTSNVPDAGGIA